ncbi:MAG: CBS domain-containing protein, partial [Deltaproteobacteria bacterium]|nr:CBS domain-containing protein [Deltaproteobacteria bacterium]
MTTSDVARHHMRVARIRHLVVVDDDHVVGVVSERDLHRTACASVAEAMTPRVLTIAPETTINRAARLMREHRIGCLPVVEGKRLVGIVTVSDMLDVLAVELRPELNRRDVLAPDEDQD